jgi:D-alanyl-D-alanine carboxypeptidase
LHRTLYLAPLAFVALLVMGFPATVAGWLDHSEPGLLAAAKGPAIAVAPASLARSGDMTALATPTVEKVPVAVASPTPLPPTATPIPTQAAPTATQVPPTATTVPPTATAVLAATGPAPIKVGNEPAPKIGAKEYIVVDGDSGEVLLEQASHRHVAPASTTKIITALVALSKHDFPEVVNASYDPSELIDSTLMGLRVGDRITLEDLLYGLMLPSGNDAALAIATHVGGSKQRFVEMMNQKTAELGLTDSHWINPHGLDADGHYSSAYDMVQFARAGMKDPRFQALAAARLRTVHAGARTYEVYNLNKVLAQVPGADGIKIGYTEDAGRTIVASVTRNGHRIYVGAFHSTDLVADSRPLFEWAFKNFSWGATTRAP